MWNLNREGQRSRSPKYLVLLCFSRERNIGDAFALVYMIYSFKEMLDFISTWNEDISCVMCWVFCLHLYSSALKWIIVGLEGTSYTGRLVAWSLFVFLFPSFCCNVIFSVILDLLVFIYNSCSERTVFLLLHYIHLSQKCWFLSLQSSRRVKNLAWTVPIM